jgi:hypothetical protein
VITVSLKNKDAKYTNGSTMAPMTLMSFSLWLFSTEMKKCVTILHFLKFQSCLFYIEFPNYIVSLGTTQIERMEEEAHSPDDDLSTLMVDDFGQSTVDQSEILYEFQTAQNAEEVNRILAEIISDYDCNQLPASKKGYLFYHMHKVYVF